MDTKKQEEIKETPLLEKKKYERLSNEIVSIQQTEVYRKPTDGNVKEAVKELNPDNDSMESRG